jgi:ER membrane protein complex subunit 7
MMEVAVIGWTFPQYKVEVNSNFHDIVKVTPVGSRIPLEPEIVLIPVGEAQYFPKKKPFNIMSLLMSPYGIMIGTLHLF